MLFNYLDITLSLNCVQNVFTFFIISKLKLKKACQPAKVEKKRVSCYGI